MPVARQAKNRTASQINNRPNGISGHHREQGILMPFGFVEEDYFSTDIMNRTEKIAVGWSVPRRPDSRSK